MFFFSRAKPEKIKIASPKNEQPKMPQPGLRLWSKMFLECRREALLSLPLCEARRLERRGARGRGSRAPGTLHCTRESRAEPGDGARSVQNFKSSAMGVW